MTELDKAKVIARWLDSISSELVDIFAISSDDALTGKLAAAAVAIGAAEVAAEAWVDTLEMAQAAQAAEEA